MRQTVSSLELESALFNAGAPWNRSDPPLIEQRRVRYMRMELERVLVDTGNNTSTNAPLQHMVLLEKQQPNKGRFDFPPVPADPTLGPSLHALQEWEGYVVDKNETEFTARLVDLTSGATHEQEEAIIPRVELSDSDNAKLCIGSIFRWVIGYEYSPVGTKKRVSQIVFRDLPAVTEDDLREGEVWAREMATFFES